MTSGTTADTTSRAGRMSSALTQAFTPAELSIEDESARHAGHSGAREGGETHYTIVIVSESFAGHSRVERSRMVHTALAPEFDRGLHALSLKLHAPGDPFS